MSNLVNSSSVDIDIIESIQKILKVREVAHEYAVLPTSNNGDLLAVSVDEMSNQIENLRMSLVVMVKKSNGSNNEVVGKKTDKGIYLP
jgi:hypothetical protein